VSPRGATPPGAVKNGCNQECRNDEVTGNEISRASAWLITLTPDILSQQSSTSPSGVQVSHRGVSPSGPSGGDRSHRLETHREEKEIIISRPIASESENRGKRLFVTNEEERNARRKMEAKLLTEASSHRVEWVMLSASQICRPRWLDLSGKWCSQQSWHTSSSHTLKH